MNIEAIQGLGMHDEVAPPAAARADTGAGAGPGFLQRVTDGLQHVNEQLLASQLDLQRLAVGDTANLHAVMIRLEEGRISFQLLLQARNRVLEAYQDVMRMQL